MQDAECRMQTMIAGVFCLHPEFCILNSTQ